MDKPSKTGRDGWRLVSVLSTACISSQAVAVGFQSAHHAVGNDIFSDVAGERNRTNHQGF